MKLYYLPGACSLAGHIVLKWVGVEHDAIRMDGESIKSQAYLALNPSGVVPLLVHGDFVLSENVAILDYVAAQSPGAGLFGDGAKGRAQTLRWLAYLNSDVHGAFKPLFSPARFLPGEAMIEPLAEQARKQVLGHLSILDRQLEGKAWLTGMRSVADPYLFVMLRWAARKHIPLDAFANLRRFMERMSDDASVSEAIAHEEGEPGLRVA
ncbi:glutathione binding-like protein [Pseudoxanthomonas sp.]|uniref:glutathione S-transferase family protein n=1 Tax=Pseudoxanthomonas sp. TaxID=1871049 RepID=UPI00261A2C95|nr:glutathione binding-like protein [Pseudoxanthomonas sp.]WDS36979.1 MAG: glutathione S-transferase N-terminal domain-containing protein [Pseudoxanthomonas sp.]